MSNILFKLLIRAGESINLPDNKVFFTNQSSNSIILERDDAGKMSFTEIIEPEIKSEVIELTLKDEYSYLFQKFSGAGLSEDDIIKVLEVIDNTCLVCCEAENNSENKCYCASGWDE